MPRVLLLLLVLGAACARAEDSAITIQVDQPGITISPTLWGIFLEEISRAGDGGIYAEMVQNRSFEDAGIPIGWTLVAGGATQGKMTLDKAKPLNSRNPTSLRLDVTHAQGERVGIANQGFKGSPQLPKGETEKWLPTFEAAASQTANGLAIAQGKEYRLSFYARAAVGFNGPVTASLERPDGTVLASHAFYYLTPTWRLFSGTLTSSAAEADARLVLSSSKTGTIWFDMVSLFPKETWKDRPNGLRKDLMEMIAAMKPAFVRFPGGSYINGDTLADAYHWKETIGPLEERPGHFCCWGYRSTDGLGYHEYLQMAQDLGAEPLYVVNCGIANDWRKVVETVPMDKMDDWVQETLDAIEYANGPVSSKYGALRARAGHPEPFHLKYVEIGNENGGGRYHDRYKLYYEAIKAKYPELHVIACDWHGLPKSAPVEIADEHDYNSPAAFMAKATRYDSYPRPGPQIYVGEYAVTKTSTRGNLEAALGEAAFMTGMERNADVVTLSSYAPLLCREGWMSWHPDAIYFNPTHAFATPAYYNQVLFANNRPDRILPVDLKEVPPTAEPRSTARMFAVAGQTRNGDEVILKVVNTQAKTTESVITLDGATEVGSSAGVTTLASENARDENSFEQPTRVALKESQFAGVSTVFKYTFPANSVTVMRIKAK